MSTVKAPKSAADVADLREHSTRPHLSPAERVREHARHQRDSHVEDAARILRKAEDERREVRRDEMAAIDVHCRESEIWAGRFQDHSQAVAHSRNNAAVRREPLTYRPPEEGGEYSMFADAWKSRMGDAGASERLERHKRESDVEMRRLSAKREAEQRKRSDALGVTYEKRVTPSRTIGAGGTFAPPLYLVEQFASTPRPDRVFTDLCANFVLPQGCQSINIPRITAGTEVQATVDASPTVDRDITDALVSSSVVTISGFEDVDLQLLEQSGPGTAHLDGILWRDLTGAFDATAERECTVGSGARGELLGFLNTTGITNITTTETTAVGMFKSIGETAAAVSNNRKLSATTWLCRGARWFWLATSEDLDNRPLFTPLDVESQEDTVVNPIGCLLGLPVNLTESIPTNLGAAKESDVIVAARPEDSYLWTSAPYLNTFDAVLSGLLQARIEMHAYVAFIAGRYPTSIAALGGSGLKIPSGF
jgi:HK97 family phage major capsid protein